MVISFSVPMAARHTFPGMGGLDEKVARYAFAQGKGKSEKAKGESRASQY
jgi:hypothetical protein